MDFFFVGRPIENPHSPVVLVVNQGWQKPLSISKWFLV
jgi:hypothetical protein